MRFPWERPFFILDNLILFEEEKLSLLYYCWPEKWVLLSGHRPPAFSAPFTVFVITIHKKNHGTWVCRFSLLSYPEMSDTAAEDIQPQPNITDFFGNVNLDTLTAEQSGYIISIRLLQDDTDILSWYGTYAKREYPDGFPLFFCSHHTCRPYHNFTANCVTYLTVM